MSSYFLLWHETRSISIRRGSIFIFFCFEIWDSAIWPMDIYSRQRKNPSPIDAFTNTSKNVYYELILSILSSAYIECNTHRFFHYYFFFVLPFSIIFLPMISVCSLLMQLKLYTFFILSILSNVKPQFTYSGQNILFKRWAEMYFVMSVFKIERSSFTDQCQHSSK